MSRLLDGVAVIDSNEVIIVDVPSYIKNFRYVKWINPNLPCFLLFRGRVLISFFVNQKVLLVGIMVWRKKCKHNKSKFKFIVNKNLTFNLHSRMLLSTLNLLFMSPIQLVWVWIIITPIAGNVLYCSKLNLMLLLF